MALARATHDGGVLAALLGILLTPAAVLHAQALDDESTALVGSLLPGDLAPDLVVHEWVTGTPITRFDHGSTYVLAFFRTSCPSCKESIPVLDRVQERLRSDGLRIVAMSLWNEPDQVARFLEEWPQGVTFSVATGTTEQMMGPWLDAASMKDAPCAFVVDSDGRIAWIGDPRRNLEEVAQAVIGGTWDTEAEREHMRDLLLLDLRAGKLLRRAGRATRLRQHAEAVSLLDEVLALDSVRFGKNAALRFNLTLIEMGDPEAAYEFLRSHWRETLGDLPLALGAVSRTILVDRRVKVRDAALAVELLERACKLTHEFDAPLLNLLATAQHATGALDAAIQSQEKALHQAAPALRTRFEAQLAKYRAEKE